MPATKTRQQKKIVRMTKFKRLQEIKAFTALCFAMLSDYSLAEVSEKTGLCYGTVHRLWSGDYTLRTTIGSLQALAYASGMHLELTESDVTITLVY